MKRWIMLVLTAIMLCSMAACSATEDAPAATDGSVSIQAPTGNQTTQSTEPPASTHTHSWVDATCTEPKTCSSCGETEGSANGHSWKAATCAAPKTCSVCQETEGAAKSHNWKAATCTAPKTCSGCGATEGAAKGHNWKAATCTAPKICSVCQATEGAAKGHTWKAATCTAPKTCSVCQATEGAAKGHTWKAATCTTPKTCSVCQTTSGEAKGHTWKAATCTAPKTCSSCQATSGAEKGHTWKSATCLAPKTCSVCQATTGTTASHSWKSATCTSPMTCSVCQATSGAAKGHIWKAATCTAPKTCSSCGATEGSANGHSWTSATCTAPQTCSKCGATQGGKAHHSYSSGACVNCGASDPNRTYGVGDKWVVNGKFELTINSVKVHTLCNSYSNDQHGYSNEDVIIIDYTYKNLGYDSLWFSAVFYFDVYDSDGEAAEAYACTHTEYAASCIAGTKCTCSQAYVLDNPGSTITVAVEYDGYSTIFKLNVSGSTGNGTEAWSEYSLNDMLDSVLDANSIAYAAADFADSSLSGTSATVQQGMAGSATRFAGECKTELYNALRAAKSGPTIRLTQGNYSTLVDALQAAYDLISPVSNVGVTTSNWRTVSQNIKTAAKSAESITTSILNELVWNN